jgi:hypothetical protein
MMLRTLLLTGLRITEITIGQSNNRSAVFAETSRLLRFPETNDLLAWTILSVLNA